MTIKAKSAGILAFRHTGGSLEIFLAHPGGPYFAKRDLGAWSIPKGEFVDEDPLTAAKREFREEIGIDIEGRFIELTPIRQKAGKWVYAWAVEYNEVIPPVNSNSFSIEYPPKSGKFREFPEIDKAEWFDKSMARLKIIPAQAALIDELMQKLQ